MLLSTRKNRLRSPARRAKPRQFTAVEQLESRQLLSTVATLLASPQDVAPGTAVTLSGSSFLPNEQVNIHIISTTSSPVDVQTQSDTNGNFVVDWNVGDTNVGATLTADATDVDGDLAEAVFTDSLQGKIFTTDVSGQPVNANHYASKDAVYLSGGPNSGPNQSGLPAGDYYVWVTSPENRNVALGVSKGTVSVPSSGVFSGYQLTANLYTVDAANHVTGTHGYNDTTNAGGEYKVWVSRTSPLDATGLFIGGSILDDVERIDNFQVDPPIVHTPGVSIVKTVLSDPPLEGTTGQSVTYHFVMTNTGDDPLNVQTLQDVQSFPDGSTKTYDLLPSIGGPFALAMGGTKVFDYTVSNVPVANAKADIHDVVTVGATDGTTSVSDSDSADVYYKDVAPSITVAKSANITTGNVGSPVIYTYTVKNTSTATIDPVTITSLVDDKLNDLLANFTAANGGSATLAYGASVTFSVSTTLPTSYSSGTYTNTVIAVGHDDEGDPTSDLKSVDVTLTFTLSGTKFLDHTGDGFTGDATNLTAYTKGFQIDLFEDANGDNFYEAGLDTLHGSKITNSSGNYTFDGLTFGKTYFVVENASTQIDPLNWFQTGGGDKNPDHAYYTDIAMSLIQDKSSLSFANAHLTSENGLSKGFWSSKNGQTIETGKAGGTTLTGAYASLFMPGSPLDKGDGVTSVLVDGNGSYITLASFKSFSFVSTFLTNASSSSNMASMLSAQLLATMFNVTSGKVFAGSSIDIVAVSGLSSTMIQSLQTAPIPDITGGTGALYNDVINVQDLINAAIAELKLHPLTVVSGTNRVYQEALKDCFDAINNNQAIFLA